MAYSEAAVTRAQQRREGQIKAHRQQREALRREVFDKLPQARELDRQLRQTAPKVLAAALRQGLDQQAALAALRRENLALQDQLAALLDQGGFPHDALEDTPLCPLCNDRGWRGSAMCSCLEELCRQEQIQELSSLLNLGEQTF